MGVTMTNQNKKPAELYEEVIGGFLIDKDFSIYYGEKKDHLTIVHTDKTGIRIPKKLLKNFEALLKKIQENEK